MQTIALLTILFTADPLAVYAIPDADTGVAWGNGTNAQVNYYLPLIRELNRNGVSVVAATTGQAGSGKEIILAGEALKTLGCVRIVAMGHSQGGSGALRAARDRPDLFVAVCPIMPGGDAYSDCPCFLVTAQYDLTVVKRAAARIDAGYPGPILHAERKRIGHYATDDAELIRRVVYFAIDDPRWLAVRTSRSWRLIAIH